jgi:long-subunit fatty acid transport protein
MGLKIDQPFLRHAAMPVDVTSRFQGRTLDVTSRQVQLQAAWAASPSLAFGASFGVARIQYSAENSVRIPVPAVPGSPVSASNPALGLMELGLRQEGNKVAPSYSLGFRWALSPRWTVGGTYVGSINATLPLQASLGALPATYFSTTGFGPPIQGTSTYGPALQSLTAVQAGSDKLTLPGKATLGVRQRVSQGFTWEVDVRYVLASSMVLPGYPTLTGPTPGVVSGRGQTNAFRGGFGISGAAELVLGKGWTVRMGLSLDSPLQQDTDVEPLVGGARNAGFSGGFSYQIWGGELNLGYQFRQGQDRDSTTLDGKWNAAGYSTTGTTTRVEGMGHLWSVGYKMFF